MISIRAFFHLLPPALAACLCGCTAGMNSAERMMWSTYPLATEKGEATGFMMNCRHAGSKASGETVMLTSSHVMETLGRGPLLVVLRSCKRAGVAEPVFLVLTPPKKRGRIFYVAHPNHDICAFHIRLPSDLAEIAETRSFVDERMLARDGGCMHSGMEVAFLGYPDVLPGTAGAFAVLRSGRVASYPVSGGRFLINSDVYPGDSGAPVIVAGDSGRPRLVGMVIQRVGPTTSSFSHLAVAVDAEAIRETLQLLATSESHPVRAERHAVPLPLPSTPNSR